MQFAFQFGSRAEEEVYDTEVKEDVQFRLEVEETIYAGNSFDAAVVVENESEVTREIKINFTAVLSYYTGVLSKKLKSYKLTFRLNSQAGKKFYSLSITNDVSHRKTTEEILCKFSDSPPPHPHPRKTN